METFVLKPSVQAVLFKMSLVFAWTVCLVVAHTMADLSEASAAFSVSPSTLTYTATVGSSNQARGVTVTNTGSTALTVTWADSIKWLVAIQPGITQTLQPGQSGAFTLTASPAGLTAGTYSGTATISGGGIITQVVPVTLSVTSGSTTPGFGLTPASLAFTGSVGGANQARGVTVTNTGSTALTVTWADSIRWFVAIQPGITQTIQPGQSRAFTLTASTAGLTAGTYSGTATISGGGITKQVPVAMTVTTLLSGAATLNWGASTSSDVVSYKVYQATGSGVYGAPIAILQRSVNSYQAIGLRANTTYFFVVTAIDAAGNESLYSNEVSKSIY